MTDRTIIIEADGLNLAPLFNPLLAASISQSGTVEASSPIRIGINFDACCAFEVPIVKAPVRIPRLDDSANREENHG